MGNSSTLEFEAGWPSRMSRLHLRLKAAARVPLHVLNTRLPPACLEARGRPDASSTFTRDLRIGNVRIALGLSDVAGIAESDPLPPQEDRRDRNRSVLETLYRTERKRLLRFVGKSALDDAEDVVQRAFTRLAARSNVADLEKPEGYLRQTARNILIDDARASNRMPAVGHAPLEEDDAVSADPVAMLEARDRLRRIETAVARLKPLTRQIFLASRVDGFSHAEIAQQTGLSVKGVEKQMGKAIRQLGRHLRDNG